MLQGRDEGGAEGIAVAKKRSLWKWVALALSAAVLAMVLWPVSATNSVSTKTKISSSLRTIYLAAIAYAEADNGGLLPAFSSDRPPAWLHARGGRYWKIDGVRYWIDPAAVGTPVDRLPPDRPVIYAFGGKVREAWPKPVIDYPLSRTPSKRKLKKTKLGGVGMGQTHATPTGHEGVPSR